MTSARSILQRPKGDGWLVLADRIPTFEGGFSNLANSLLAHADLSYQPLCIVGDEIGDPSLPTFLTDLEVLLNIEIAVATLKDIEELDSVSPGILILTGGTPEDWVAALGDTTLGDIILEAITEGLLLFVADSAALALGAWIIEDKDEFPIPGINWLVGSMILPWTEAPAEFESVRSALLRPDPLYAMGLAGGRIIALGPSGDVELWGVDAPTIVLGSGWCK